MHEFEEVLQKLATDVASRAISEKLTTPELLNKTKNRVESLKHSAKKTKKPMMILKPGKANTINTLHNNFVQTLTTFEEILIQDSPDPAANSRLAFEQLRKALTDGSDLLLLMREIRDSPSLLMDGLINLKKAAETKGPVISIQAKKDVQPLIKHIMTSIDQLRSELIDLDKKVGNMKKIMRDLQEGSLKTLLTNTDIVSDANKSNDQAKQMYLSNFKKEKNEGNSNLRGRD